ncbi:uncharacterized protein LOC142333269 isoform X2 [Lycorma delicatula]|uniref:uncharacterized protein LOC142333269 isoform X2 n=1 Tax=Lycorma delicatula TaxID=130591 RepID=UPI003F50E1A4
MNKTVSDARQKLSDLRKKYCVDNLKKYEKTFSSSDESLTVNSKKVLDTKNVKKENYIVSNKKSSLSENEILSTGKSIELEENYSYPLEKKEGLNVGKLSPYSEINYAQSVDTSPRYKSNSVKLLKISVDPNIDIVQSSKKPVDSPVSEISSIQSLKNSISDTSPHTERSYIRTLQKSVDINPCKINSVNSLKELINGASSYSEISPIQSLKKSFDHSSEHSEIRSIQSLNKVDSEKVLSDVEVYRDISSVKSLEDKSNSQSEIEEILSDSDIEDDKSIIDPLANVHLVSDEILEDFESSIELLDSIKEKTHGGELSAIQSVKAFPLSSPIEPPQLDLQDYESDFEESENESEQLSVEEDRKSYNDISDNKSKLNSESRSKFLIEDELEKHDIIEFPVSLTKQTTTNSSNDISIDNRKSSVEEIESEIKTESVSDSKITTSITKNQIKSSSSKSKNTGSHLLKIEPDIKSSTSKSKSDKKIIKKKHNFGVVVKLPTSSCKNVSVQTSDSIGAFNKIEEIISPTVKRKQKIYINTSVRNTKYRPTVKTSRLLKDTSFFQQDTEFNPYKLYSSHGDAQYEHHLAPVMP